MRRISLSVGLLGLLFNGCAVVVEPGPAQPVDIPPVQFLRPTFDSETGTWVSAWVDPQNFAASQSGQ